MAQVSPNAPLISDYGHGRFVIAEEVHEGPILILGADISGFSIHPWRVTDRTAISKDDFVEVLSSPYRPDLVVIGVGASMDHPYMSLRRDLNAAGLTVEIQTTAAACRTWNLLLSEGRKVAFAALEILEKA